MFLAYGQWREGFLRPTNEEFELIVYTKPGCTSCRFTELTLDRMGAKYEPREFDEEALKLAQSKGITSAPMVVVGDVVWGGHRENLIKEYAVL